MIERCIIRGCGGHARSVADVLLFNLPRVQVVFVDDAAKERETIMGFPVLKATSLPWVIHNAIGDNKRRRESFMGTEVVIISESAYCSPLVRMGVGVFVAHSAHVGPQACIGDGVVVNTAAVLEHDTVIGDFSHISVNATICGYVRLGREVFVGAGAVVRDKITITDSVTLGAGAVVVKDIVVPGVYVGNPAVRIK